MAKTPEAESRGGEDETLRTRTNSSSLRRDEIQLSNAVNSPENRGEDVKRLVFRLGLSARVRNVLLRAIYSNGLLFDGNKGLCELPDEELMGFKGIGQQAVAEIRHKLKEASERGQLPISEEDLPQSLHPKDLQRQKAYDYRKKWYQHKKATEP